jgi:hypothetical protein
MPTADPCPLCGGAAVTRCRCRRSDSTCAAGHRWHRCTAHGTLVVGESDHAAKGCTCRPGATFRWTLEQAHDTDPRPAIEG